MNDVAKIQPDEHVLPADPVINVIERVLTDPNADLDKLERMLAMKERVDREASRRAFAFDLAQARADIPPIIKDATVDYESRNSGGRTHYKHETLSGIAKVIDPILSQHGISYRFRTDQGNGGVKVTCIIQHKDGHSEETSLFGAPDGSGSKNSFQAVGSAVTYLQRYTLKAALGLSAEADDDGQSAAPRQEQRQQHQERQPDHGVAQAEADRMITAIRRDGLSVCDHPQFKENMQRMQSEAPDIAAQVEVEIDSKRQATANERPLTNFDDEIPY